MIRGLVVTVRCPTWCTADHARARHDHHTATLLDAGQVEVLVSCTDDEPDLIVEVSNRNGMPLELLPSVTAALKHAASLAGSEWADHGVHLDQPTPKLLAEAIRAHGLEHVNIPREPGAPAPPHDGMLHLHSESDGDHRVLLFAFDTADLVRLDDLARTVMKDDGATWHLVDPADAAVWCLPLWLA